MSEGRARDLGATYCDECKAEFNDDDWVVKLTGHYLHPRCME